MKPASRRSLFRWVVIYAIVGMVMGPCVTAVAGRHGLYDSAYLFGLLVGAPVGGLFGLLGGLAARLASHSEDSTRAPDRPE